MARDGNAARSRGVVVDAAPYRSMEMAVAAERFGEAARKIGRREKEKKKRVLPESERSIN